MLSGIQPDQIFKGLFLECENLRPDYDLVPNWNKKEKASILFSSRGCIRHCSFCAVPKLEGSITSSDSSIKHLIYPGHDKVILFDNNFLASPNWEKVLTEIKDENLRVDFNQGLDARLITEDIAKKLSEVNLYKMIRLSYDNRQIGKQIKNAITYLKSAGIPGKQILVYTLYNFIDTPQDFFERMREVLRLGAVCYPMRYEPLITLYKNRYISPKWDDNSLNAIQKARRIIGFGGAFAPHEGMLKLKVEEDSTFESCFGEFMEES